MASPRLSDEEVELLERYWRASNYLTVGQIYLRGKDPLLTRSLQFDDIKARLLGHWGTCPGINFVYTHMNRVIKKNNLNALLVCGPGHGGPGVVSHVYLEGTYSEIYPEIAEGTQGMGQLLKQFSWPRGIPSHVAPFCPGSLHEGGELGYCLLHAFGAVLDNPSLVIPCIVGDGEAETGPLATSWHSAKFINPATDGAVLPILHLNGGKIGSATVLSRLPDTQLNSLFEGYGYKTYVVDGDSDDTKEMHQKFSGVLDASLADITAIQTAARSGSSAQPTWPMIILRTPKGWTGPKELGGNIVEGTFRSHQVPIADAATSASDLTALEAWLRSYRPDECFMSDGKLKPELCALRPPKELCMGRNPHANGGLLMEDLALPSLGPYEHSVPKPGVVGACTTIFTKWLRDVCKQNMKNFRVFCPDELTSNKMSAVFEVIGRNSGFFSPDPKLDSPFEKRDGRAMEILSEHCCQGWYEAYVLSGRHGIFPCYESFAQVVDSMLNQHAKWLKATMELPFRKKVPSLNYLLTSHTWRQDHNGYSHQSPGFIDNAVTKPPVTNIFFPPDGNTLLAVGKRCFESRHKINLIVAGKHPMPQWLNLKDAEAHVAAGAAAWKWAGTEDGTGVDVVLACAGDVPTLETMAAAQWLRKRVPELRTRVVNVVDLYTLAFPGIHENAFSETKFEDLFGTKTPVVFYFHGTPHTIHGFLYRRRSAAGRFGVHGYIEEGSTTTPFDLTVMNEASRYHLIIDALERVAAAQNVAPQDSEYYPIVRELKNTLKEHAAYVWENGEDMPCIRDWTWGD